MEKNWVEAISKKVDQQAQEYISVKDFRFYQIEKLKRIAKLLDRQGSCLDCKYAKAELEKIVDELDRLINKSGVNRSEYEKRVEKLLKHLKKEHGVYQIHHFTYTYSAIYGLLGMVFGLLLTYGLFYSFNSTVFFLCAGVGMIVGNILGNRKDRECKRNGKQL
ncbi:hypothetical protein [Marinifilum caeruleilacunae]|uniref:Uncharacterized protein n=1 Tax=Marinifilum caeruleilacunae TaxID=2499076 RepID=A0ABX1X0A4_9BACT|nr:hypothetical protein [Marinifilum caeruleilacunae]NOU61848.1 hypothetical protein [Marinifilum caeruleilacunae]